MIIQILLISFLGRVNRDVGGDYRSANYRFPDGHCQQTSFLGLALAERLCPAQFRVLGTAGSMWGVLIESHWELGREAESLRLELQAAEDRSAVTQAMLDALAPLLGEHLGLEVDLRIIPYGRNEAEQLDILRAMEPGGADGLVLDVTHGFRHLSMLALMASQYVKSVYGVPTEAVYYGALDMSMDGIAPVLDLGGLLRMADWVRAFAGYEAGGDYGLFGHLLGGQAGEILDDAAFHQRSNNPVMARSKLAGLPQPLPARDLAGQLFSPHLERRLQWWKAQSRWQWEAALARENLERGDYLRATLFGYEAALSRECEQRGLDRPDFDARKTAAEEHRHADGHFRQLNFLRNNLAHGDRPQDDRILRAVQDEASLRAMLKKLFKALLD